MQEEKGFELVSAYQPTGDQPQAIQQLAEGVLHGDKEQTLLGVTGSGKTFTMANIIKEVNRPTLVLAHNKTLAAQLCSEFKAFFQIMRWNTLSLTTTIISRRPISRIPIPISKRTVQSMMRSRSSDIRLLRHCPNAGMSSSLPVFPASIRWVTQSITATW